MREIKYCACGEENGMYVVPNLYFDKEWTKYAEDNLLFDMPESIELGIMSDRHWEEFIKWVKTK